MAHFAVRLVHGPGWDSTRPIREQDGWDEHAAANEQDVKTGFARDPWASARLLQIGVIEPWALWLDSRPEQAPRRRSDSVPG